ncbi:MAG: hypothetical protein KAQ79_04630, partial [Cyclobacteriaceae bacterium]|nr:hypothetical protein [Cyclobacteriaceae bacterium]
NGSVVYIDDKIVVDNAGYSGEKVDKGKTTLSIGWHKLSVFYYENDGTESLDFKIEGPGLERQPFPVERVFFEEK